MSEPLQEVPLPPEEVERLRKVGEAILGLPTEPYLGLTLADAEHRAAFEGRELVVSDPSRGRPVLIWRRLRVVLDADGRVVEVAAG